MRRPNGIACNTRGCTAYTVHEEPKRRGGISMRPDRSILRQLLAMDDAQLRLLIGRIASQAGVDISGADLSAESLAAMRRAVDSASDEELEAVMGEFLGGSKK